MIKSCSCCGLIPNRPQTSRGGQGFKLRLDRMQLVKELKRPRNEEKPTGALNLYKFMMKREPERVIFDDDPAPIYESRLPTHTTKQRTENNREIDEEDATSGLHAVASLKILPHTKTTSSAFYKMKHARQISHQKPTSRKLNIGPIFDQVSKYVTRPQTQQQVRMKYSEIEEPVPRFNSTNMEFGSFKLPITPKVCLVQSLMKTKK